jgi:hypothetical protein
LFLHLYEKNRRRTGDARKRKNSGNRTGEIDGKPNRRRTREIDEKRKSGN